MIDEPCYYTRAYGPFSRPPPTTADILKLSAKLMKGMTMHYKNGREAKNGDKIVFFPSYIGTPPVVGILYDAVAGNDFCNGKLAVTAPNDPMPNLKECLHLDDVLAAMNGGTKAT